MKNTRRLPPIAYVLFAIVLVWSGNQLWQSITHSGQTTLTDRRSNGERLLITEIDSSDKRSGIESFANGDYNSAIEHFQASLKESRNDVETRLYLQNTIAIQKVGDPKKLVKIAVVVPLDPCRCRQSPDDLIETIDT